MWTRYATAVALMLLCGVASAEQQWTMTDLRIAGFYATGLPSEVRRGRVAEPGELRFLLRDYKSAPRYVCTVTFAPGSDVFATDSCARLAPGETP